MALLSASERTVFQNSTGVGVTVRHASHSSDSLAPLMGSAALHRAHEVESSIAIPVNMMEL